MNQPLLARLWVALSICALLATPSLAQIPLGTAFTYQGQLDDGGSPANGTYDFRLILYDAAVGGSQVGPIVTPDDVVVSNGLFTVALDFGAVFDGVKRFMEIGVRPGASGGAYTAVAPRQQLTPSPNALFASTAANAAGNAFRVETSSSAQNAVLELNDNSPGQAQLGAVNFLQAGSTTRGRIAYQNPDGPMTFRVAGAQGLSLSSTGLDVNAGNVTFGSANGAISYQNPDGPMTFTVGGTTRMTLSSAALDVAGNMTVPDGFTIFVSGGPANMTIAGANAVFQIGDTVADKVGIGRTPVTNSLEVVGSASKATAGS